MNRLERFDDPVAALRTSLDGRASEIWTALPGIVVSFNPTAMTVVVQPSIKGSVEIEDGSSVSVILPLLVDVPVVFPAGGGFTLTYPIASGDDCLVVFASRCIDAWWQSGGVQEPLETRMHDLSDGFCFVGPFSQPRVLPNVSTSDVQLRSDDGNAYISIKPDYTINAVNPAASIELTPTGEVTATADAKITLNAPLLEFKADSMTWTSQAGGATSATFTGDINQTGSITSTGDHVANGISLDTHVHSGVTTGPSNTGVPV